MKVGIRLFAAVIVTVLAGCATIPRPTAVDDTLVVGDVSVTVTNGASFGALGANGFHRSGIVVYLKNLTSGETVHATSSSSGLFYASGLRPGHYSVVRLFYEITTSNWGYSQSVNPNLSFSVVAGKVTNLGRIDWSTNETTARESSTTAELDSVKRLFAAAYPGSKWIGGDWVGPTNAN